MYVSTTNDVGQLVTIRDIDGFLSSPQSILVSTTEGVSITGGFSTIRLQQGFGFVTLRSVSTTEWTPVNSNSFADPMASYSYRGATFSNAFIASNVTLTSSISTGGAVTGRAATLTSSATLYDTLYTSTLAVNNYPRFQGITTGPFVCDVIGSLLVQSNMEVRSSISTIQSAAFLSNLGVAGSLTLNSSITVANILYSTLTGTFTIAGQISTANIFTVLSTAQFSQSLFVSTTGRFGSNTTASTVSTRAADITALITANGLFQSTSIYHRSRPDITVVSPTYTGLTTPVVELQPGASVQTATVADWVATSTMGAGGLTVVTAISCPTLLTLAVPNAVIRNPGGGLVVSSVQSGSLTLSNAFYGQGGGSNIQRASTQAFATSTLQFTTLLQTQGQLTVGGRGVTDSISTNNVSTAVLDIGGLVLSSDSLALNSVFVSTSFVGTQMSSMGISSVTFNNTGGSITCSTVITNTVSTSAGITSISQLTTLQPVFLFSTAGVRASTMSYGSLAAGTGVTSSIVGTSITFGTPLDYSTFFSPSTPFVVASTVSGLSNNTPYEYVTGLGTMADPLQIRAAFNRTVAIYGQNLTASTSYLNANVSYTNDGSAVGSAGLRYYNPLYVSTILTFNASPIVALQKQTLSNFVFNPYIRLSTNQYFLQGPTTFLPPSTVTQSQVMVAGGASTYEFAYSGDGGTTWTSTDRFTINTQVQGLAWGGDKWLACGQGTTNTLAYSYTGVVWFGLGNAIFTTRAAAVAYNGQIWVAVGTGTNTIAYSLDGVSWIGIGTAIFSTEGTGVAWNGTQWVATGAGTNSLASSTNGTSWTGAGVAIFTRGAGVAWGSGKWIAVGTGTWTAASSTNGTTWTGFALGPSLTAVAYSGTQWLAGSSVSPQIYSSSDGVAWASVSLTATITSVSAIAWCVRRWVVTGTPGIVVTSTDGVIWTAGATVFGTSGLALATQAPLQNTVSTSPLLVATGATTIATSATGLSWSTVASPFTTRTACVAWNGTLWVAGGEGTNVIARSSNGTTWTGAAITGMTAVNSVAWGRGQWVAVGTGTNNLAVSSDGIAWTAYAPATSGFFDTSGNGVAWAENVWAAVGGNTGIAYSANGTTWTRFVDSIFTNGRGIAFNGYTWVAVGAGPNSIATSLDGFSWVGLGTSVFSAGGTAVAYNGNRWVATGAGTNTLAYSLDGATWIGAGATVFTTTGTGVSWSPTGIWIATGTGTNSIATSPDGINWTGQGLTTFSPTANAVAANTILPVTTQTALPPTVVRWTMNGLCLLSSTQLLKPEQVTDGWNAAAYSQDGYTANAFLQFKSSQAIGSYMIGLSENPAATTSYTSINYAFFVNINNVIQFYELGFLVGTSAVAHTVGSVLQLKYDGVNVIYSVNSTVVRTVARATGAALYATASIKKPGTGIREIEFSPLFRLASPAATPSTISYAISQVPGNNVPQFQPVQFPLTSNLTPCRYTLFTTLGGTIQSPSTIFYASIYQNSTLLGSTNSVQPTYGASPSTYQLYFSTTTTYPVVTGDVLQLQYTATRSDGDLYLYGSFLYSNGVTTTSTCVTQEVWNPFGVDYFEYFHTNGNSGLQTSEVQFQLATRANDPTSYVNSNYGIEMNLGYMVWNNALNGITIQNKFNDIRTRSVLYTGAIYNPSDSNLKTDIEFADTAALYSTLDALPLRRYAMSQQYMDTFGTQDRRQIGVVTSDVAIHIPGAVHDTEFGYCGLSTLHMVEKNALQFTHLGATQELARRVSTLATAVQLLKKRFKIPSHFVESGV